MPPEQTPLRDDKKAFHWRREDAYLTVSGTAFAKLVAEDGLRVLGPFGGYFYAMKHTTEGEELYRTSSGATQSQSFWTYTNRFTEANAGGGNNVVKITPDAGTAMKLVEMRVQMCDAAAGRTAGIYTLDEDGVTRGYYAYASLDNQSLNIPSIGGTAGTAANVGNSIGLIVLGDGSCVQVYVAALANAEFFDIICTWELLGTVTAPTVAHTSSGTASTGTASQNEVTTVLL